MSDFQAAVAFGAGLVILGAWLIRWHRTVWVVHRADAAIDDREKRHYRLQFRRRVQIAALLILLGILLPVGTWMTEKAILQRKNVQWMAGFWIAVLIIALWIMVLAAFDWLSTRMHVRATRAALGSLARQQRELEAEVERLRNRRSNGQH